MSCLNQLLRESVDYAGLFPPAALPLEQVVANYRGYRESAESSMLARLIIPASRLNEFADIAQSVFGSSNQSPWKISALIPPVLETAPGKFDSTDTDAAQEVIKQFNAEYASSIAIVDAVEIKTAQSLVKATIASIPTGQSAFLEIPWNADPTPAIESIQKLKSNKSIFAKIRTGGVTPSLIPSVHEVARFLFACADRNVGFKATAGLHHPIRANQKLTYQPDAPEAIMHGFVNVFVAAALAFGAEQPLTITQNLLEEVLIESDASAFTLSADKVGWKDYCLTAEQVKKSREAGIISFGSCSFTEPTAELTSLHNVDASNVFA